MRRLSLALIAILFGHILLAQESAEKMKGLDYTIDALYDVISGDAGKSRDWNRMRSLFAEGAQLIPSGGSDTGISFRRMTVEDYIETVGPRLTETGFFEAEIGRKTEIFGSLAHVFSTYESRRTIEDEKPFMRGINSIQLLHNGDKWLIMNIYWLGESPQNLIPDQYLQKP